ncbi:MAG: zf-HC2 domain-containing protein [Candidatus Aminicenantes bacterium]|nr:zf-HC2 domain-containing protein [Candidatus Aminicenantes bacterium]
MNECPNEDRIDGYLTGRLTESETAELEEHYFNCSACFQKLSERNKLVEVIRDRGAEIFEGADAGPIHSWKKAPWKDGRSGGIFPPDRWKETPSTGILPKVSWPVTAAAAAVLLAAVLVLIPTFKGRDLEIVSTGDEAVRGESLILLSPRGEVKAAPAAFEWKAVGAAAEYRLALSGPETLWTTVTKATKADLTDNVKRAMKPGLYQWQVKAYSAQGTLLTASPKVEFKISN